MSDDDDIMKWAVRRLPERTIEGMEYAVMAASMPPTVWADQAYCMDEATARWIVALLNEAEEARR